jgi:outer membrane protein assembly factor BamD (BamD/ComL family)
MSKQFFWLTLLTPLLLLCFLMGGCAVLSPVGKAIASGYDNMVAYFNTYYDAKQTFDEAEEDTKAFLLTQRGKEVLPPLPADLIKKFDKVIDKCSNILAFHRTSSSADDALFLIGKSFFYQQEYIKAEKKFNELISQYPNGDRYSEACLWSIRALERQNRTAEAMEAAETFLVRMEQEKNRELQYQCLLEIGVMNQQQRLFAEAADQFSKARSVAGSDKDQIPLLYGLGDCAYAQRNDTAAAEFYLAIPKLDPDLYDLFRSRMNAAIVYRQGGMPAKSLALLNVMIDDYRMKEYRGYLYLERGRTERKLYRMQAALDDFHYVDTTSRQNSLTYEASYEIGSLDEKIIRDYPAALIAYTRSTAAPGGWYIDSARQRTRALSLYLEAQQRLWKADSLLSIRWDTVTAFRIDSSVSVSRDSVSRGKRAQKFIPPSPDSLQAVKSVSYQEIGDVLYAEMDMPDSALSSYLKAEALCRDSVQLPRILFVLSELANIDSVKAPLSSAEYLKSIIRRYPESPYANQARRNLGWAVVEEKTDSAKGFYEQGEHAIDKGQFVQALENFSEIEKRYPLSPLAAKSVFAKGWIYEYRLKKYDSAAVQYKILERKYTSSSFARIVHGRTLEENLTDAHSDTLKRALPDTAKGIFPGVLKRTLPDTVKGILPGMLKKTVVDTVKRAFPDTLKNVLPDTLSGSVPIRQKQAVPAEHDTIRKVSQSKIMVD